MKRVLFVLLLAACGSKPSTETTTPVTNPPIEQTDPTADTDARFEGTITEIDFGCASDALCHVTIDGTKHVRFGHDTRGAEQAPWGNSDALMALMDDPTKGVGTKVSVYAAADGEPDHYTMKGKADYFINIVE